jgi:hypothetical protein
VGSGSLNSDADELLLEFEVDVVDWLVDPAVRAHSSFEHLQQFPACDPLFRQVAQLGWLQALHLIGVPRNIVAQQAHFVFVAIIESF